jgi:hypothetical protein
MGMTLRDLRCMFDGGVGGDSKDACWGTNGHANMTAQIAATDRKCTACGDRRGYGCVQRGSVAWGYFANDTRTDQVGELSSPVTASVQEQAFCEAMDGPYGLCRQLGDGSVEFHASSWGTPVTAVTGARNFVGSSWWWILQSRWLTGIGEGAGGGG